MADSKDSKTKAKRTPETHLQAIRMGLKPEDTYTCRMVSGHTHRQGHKNKPVVIPAGEEFIAPGYEIAGLGFRVEIKQRGGWAPMPKMQEEAKQMHRGELRAKSGKVRLEAARLHRAMLTPGIREALEMYPLPTHLGPFVPSQAALDKARKAAEKEAGLQPDSETA